MKKILVLVVLAILVTLSSSFAADVELVCKGGFLFAVSKDYKGQATGIVQVFEAPGSKYAGNEASNRPVTCYTEEEKDIMEKIFKERK